MLDLIRAAWCSAPPSTIRTVLGAVQGEWVYTAVGVGQAHSNGALDGKLHRWRNDFCSCSEVFKRDSWLIVGLSYDQCEEVAGDNVSGFTVPAADAQVVSERASEFGLEEACWHANLIRF